MQVLLTIPWFVAEPKVIELPWGPMTIQPFGFLVWVGLTVGLIVALWFAKKFDRSPAMTLDLSIFLVAFAFPVSYLFNGVLYQTESFRALLQDPSRFLEIPLGWSSFGGVLGAVIGGFVWKWWRKDSLLRVGEAHAFAGPFGWACARLGCFVTHDHPGHASDFFLAVEDFQFGSPPFYARHDLGLYDMLVLAAIALLFVFLSRKPRAMGFYVALLPLLYMPFRFGFDFLRAAPAEGGDARYSGLTPGQYGAIVLFIVGAILMRRVVKTPRFQRA